MELELKNHITSSISESESVSSEEQAGASLAEVADSFARSPFSPENCAVWPKVYNVAIIQ
jgi:hypothetical protein